LQAPENGATYFRSKAIRSNGEGSGINSRYPYMITRISDIDRFNYLKRYLDGEALGRVTGLNLISDNYKEVINLLRERFGNEQILISAHMESLLKISKIRSKENLKGLRNLYNHVESCVRNLRSLNLETKGYGSLLIPLLKDKLPDDLTIIISRKFGSSVWTLDKVLEYFNDELRAQENCASNFSNQNSSVERQSKGNYSAIGLHAQASKGMCIFCKKQHPSAKCRTVTNVSSRKGILRKERRCFLCLEENHSVRDCTSKYVCRKCNTGNHHISICEKSLDTLTAFSYEGENNEALSTPGTGGILMQTAKAHVLDTNADNVCLSRILFDTGSQRSYISANVRQKLKLKTIRTERVVIKTFGEDNNSKVNTLDVVQVKIRHARADDVYTFVEALCVPKICCALKNQDLNQASKLKEFTKLDLADNNFSGKDLPIGLLIGVDHYFRFFTGKSIHSNSGTVATESTLGWVLSGQINSKLLSDTPCLATHNLRCSVENAPENPESIDILRHDLNKFWNIENVGSSQCVINKFEHDIFHDGKRYVTKLPFKVDHDCLPDNFDICKKRLLSLKSRLTKQNILEDYHKIFKEYEEVGIIERVSPNELCKENGQCHYMPHRPVVREDRATTKIRAVFDASCKVSGPSLNECLYSGPNLLLKLFDVLIRFRLNKIAMLADIKQAFLNVGINVEHQDYLRFLWFDADNDDLIVYRFTRAVFGLTSSPFLLNATVRHHLSKFVDIAILKEIVEKVMEDLYVDDLISGCDSIEEGKLFYKKIKGVMSGAGFILRKWISNNTELSTYITSQESNSDDVFSSLPHCDKGVTVLGLKWDTATDELVFDFNDLLDRCRTMKKTKRGLLSTAASVFDPIGVIAPITSRIKTIFQILCNDKLDWDDVIPDNIFTIWSNFVTELTSLGEIRIPRLVFTGVEKDLVEIHGFCDSSKEVYCAVLYLRVVAGTDVRVSFLASKTRVAPLKQLSIPRLELMGCLLLTRLLSDVLSGLKNRVVVQNVVCWSDSQVSLAWIKGKEKKWKPWVENRVVSIRKVVDRNKWYFVKGELNPADIPTRISKGLVDCFDDSWLSGPSFLLKSSVDNFISNDELNSSETFLESKKSFLQGEGCDDFKTETETNHYQTNLTVTTDINVCLSEIINVGRFSCLRKLVVVTGFVIRYITNLKNKIRQFQHKNITEETLTVDEYNNALTILIIEEQRIMRQQSDFTKLEKSLKLFTTDDNVYRLKGRFQNSTMTTDEKHPIILRDGSSTFTKLVIWDAHQEVMHHGIETTLACLRKKFWIIKGRKTVKSVIRKCVICIRHQAKTLQPEETPDLPDFRIDTYSKAFNATGIDFAGPLFYRNLCKSNCKTDSLKCYILLLTCATSRAIHLELVSDMSTQSFIRAFRRFVALRGTPSLITHDNAKTFKATDVKTYMLKRGIKQQFILPASPWWGGFYERLVRSVKTSLKKTLGRSMLSFEELTTTLSEIGAVINTRPLTYANEDDLESVLTPNHLIYGNDIFSNVHHPSSSAIETYEDCSRRVKHLQLILKHFRDRFQQNYLAELRQTNLYRKRNTGDCRRLIIGDIVLIKDDIPLPRGRWRVGRIIELIVGRDGAVRGAKLKTTSNQGRHTTAYRPTKKLIPFEITDQQQTFIPTTASPPPTPTTASHTEEPEPAFETHDRHKGVRSTRKAAIEGQNLRMWKHIIM